MNKNQEYYWFPYLMGFSGEKIMSPHKSKWVVKKNKSQAAL